MAEAGTDVEEYDVLVVEDNKVQARALRREFARHHRTAKVAYSRVEALKLAEALSFRSVAVDVHLTSADPKGGLEVVRRIRQHDKKQGCLTYVAAITGHAEWSEEASAAGTDDLIVKDNVRSEVLEFLARFEAHARRSHQVQGRRFTSDLLKEEMSRLSQLFIDRPNAEETVPAVSLVEAQNIVERALALPFLTEPEMALLSILQLEFRAGTTKTPSPGGPTGWLSAAQLIASQPSGEALARFAQDMSTTGRTGLMQWAVLETEGDEA